VCGEVLPYTETEHEAGFWSYKRDMCACERKVRDEREAREKVEAQVARTKRVAHLRQVAGLTGRLAGMRLSNLKRVPGIGTAINAAEAYVDAWPQSGGLILQGPFGCGKTHLAAAIGNEIIERHRACVKFYPGFELLEAIRRGYGTDDTVAEDCARAGLFICDDLGNERIARDEHGDWAREQFFRIFYWRELKELPVVITTNYGLEELGEHIGMPTLSRLLGMCGRPVKIEAPDYRLNYARERRR